MPRTNSNDDRTGGTERPAAGTNRREYLKLAGAAAVGLTAASAPAAAAAPPTDDEFSKTVDMVADAGCDPTGGESCVDAITEYAGDDTLLQFPSGEYLIDSPVGLSGYGSLGIEGTDDDVSFVFPDETGSGVYLSVVDVGDFLYRNIDWDITAVNCAPGIVLGIEESFYLGQLEMVGRGDSSGGFALRPAVRADDGIGVIEEFVATEGSKFDSAPRGGVLVSTGRNNGTLRFVDCHLEEFENNGLYAAASAGPIQVEGGTFRNNLRSQLRFSGAGSYIEDALVEVDYDAIPAEAEPEAFSNARGIWWESKNTEPLRSGGEIRDTTVHIKQSEEGQTLPNTGGGIVVRRDGGACTIKDSTVRMDVTPRPAVYAKAPAVWDDADHPAPPGPRALVMENVDIVGDAKDEFAVQIEGRPGSVIRDCYFEQRFRYGLVLAGCDDSAVEDSEFEMRGAPQVALWGSDHVKIKDVTSNQSGPLVIGDSDYDDHGHGHGHGGGHGHGHDEDHGHGHGKKDKHGHGQKDEH